jgi:hypothetical protein
MTEVVINSRQNVNVVFMAELIETDKKGNLIDISPSQEMKI